MFTTKLVEPITALCEHTWGEKKTACLRRVSRRDSAAACRACQDSFQTQVDARVLRAAKPGSSEEDVAGAQPLSTVWTTCQLCLLEKCTSLHLRGYAYEWAMYIYVRQHNKSSMLYKYSWSSRGWSFTGKKLWGKKGFAHRACAERPTSAVLLVIFWCERAFQAFHGWPGVADGGWDEVLWLAVSWHDVASSQIALLLGMVMVYEILFQDTITAVAECEVTWGQVMWLLARFDAVPHGMWCWNCTCLESK